VVSVIVYPQAASPQQYTKHEIMRRNQLYETCRVQWNE